MRRETAMLALLGAHVVAAGGSYLSEYDPPTDPTGVPPGRQLRGKGRGRGWLRKMLVKANEDEDGAGEDVGGVESG